MLTMALPTTIETRFDGRIINELRKSLRGILLGPADKGYDAARRVWNGRIDRKPTLIVRCAGVADIVHAVNFAQRYNIPLSVRSTGHNVTGCAVCDNGLTIDLSLMKGIHVDPVRIMAHAQPGVTWGEFDHETQAFGLATTGGRISTTGIAGVTIGGGYGWLMRKYGLAIDNLKSVDIVTADGSFLTASATTNADLFWGVRGGGGNFGIITSLEFQLHPIGPLVTGGMVFYPAAQATELLHFYREFMATASNDLEALFNFLVAPSAPFVPQHLQGLPVVAIAICHVGSLDDARHDLTPLFELGQPLLNRIGPMPYTRLQRLFDAAGVFGYFVHGKSGHLLDLSDEVIDTLVTHAANMTSPLSIVMISSLGGALGCVGEHDTAFSHRNTAFDYAIDSIWSDPCQSEKHMRWADDFGEVMRPFSTGVYVNELGDEGEERVQEAYSPTTYARLVALKNKYDPYNLFRHNQNIKPSMKTI
jgi:FAD/FMN-containing dehydrogenase